MEFQINSLNEFMCPKGTNLLLSRESHSQREELIFYYCRKKINSCSIIITFFCQIVHAWKLIFLKKTVDSELF